MEKLEEKGRKIWGCELYTSFSHTKNTHALLGVLQALGKRSLILGGFLCGG